MNMYRFKVTTSNRTITTVASSYKAVVELICNAELCPERAILNIKMLEVIE